MKILVKYPTKRRWPQFKRNFTEYVQKCSELNKVSFLVTVDTDDHIPQDVLDAMSDVNVRLDHIKPSGKVAAINHGIPFTGWNYLVVVSDDMIPVETGWDIRIRDDFLANPHALAINYRCDERLAHDAWKGLMTLPVLSNEYYAMFGFVYNPVYMSEFCDLEQTAVLARTGRLVHVETAPIRHEWAKYQTDALAAKNMADGQIDRKIYEHRSKVLRLF